MLANIKLLLSITDNTKDNLLTLLIAQCTADYKSITHATTIDETIVEQMVVYRYNTLGTEGVNSEGYSGVSYSYTNDYPNNILALLKSRRRVMTID